MRGLTPAEARVCDSPRGTDLTADWETVEGLILDKRAVIEMGEDGWGNVRLTPAGRQALYIHRVISTMVGPRI